MNEEKQIMEMMETLGRVWIPDLDGNPHDLREVLWQCDLGAFCPECGAQMKGGAE